MNRINISIVLIFLPILVFSQISEAFDNFEGDSNISSWFGDDCGLNSSFANPYPQDNNTSTGVLQYNDTGGQFANIRFEMDEGFDLTVNQTFAFKIYIPSNGVTGNQTNQVSLKLQNGFLSEPWSTQSEIIKPVVLDEWQTVTFNFESDNYINLDPSSPPPILRTDFNRVVIQVNGENNTDQVLAFIDDFLLYNPSDNDPVFNQLVWSDEFDIDGAVDSEKWFHQTLIPQGNSWFNGEVQHYTDRLDNTYVEDGILNIVAKKESFTDQGTTKQYTSARLNSKFAFTYGRVEVRAKLPSGVGTWPAIWMLGKNVNENGAYWETQGFGTTGWPACGEMDIMEHWGNNQNYVSSATHTPSSYGATINYGGQYLATASTDFHVYSLIWTAEKLEFSVDGIIHFTYNPENKDDETWPFTLDQYILFNVAILPSIEASFTESSLEIDYIRIYQEGEVTSTQELLSDDIGIVYPNPFDNELFIETKNLSGKVAHASVFNSKGALVTSHQGVIDGGRFQINSLEKLSKGIYFIQYIIDDKVYHHKVLKK